MTPILDRIRTAYRDGEPVSLSIAEMGELLDVIDALEAAAEGEKGRQRDFEARMLDGTRAL